MDLSEADRAFRDSVRAFLDEKFSPELRSWARRQAGVFAEPELARRWHRILFEQGWVAPSWPKEYGGPGFKRVQRYIFQSELAEAGAPTLPAMGLQMCGPVLMGRGTPEQKSYFLPRILSGEHYWCQGYSEPGSGSDLASLQCRAVRDGDDYVINGSKIWTTHAHAANWMFLLVRTSTEGKPQAGISFLLLDMASPGITIRPIVSISGEHEINQVFFDNVRTPISLRVGEENKGWGVAKYLLEFERGGGSYAPRLKSALRQVRAMARGLEGSDDDPEFRQKLVAVEMDVLAVDLMERRVVSQASSGESVGDAAASTLKLRGSETMQRVTELATDVLGRRLMLDPAGGESPASGQDCVTTTARYFNARAATIYGGSSEVQLNILARAALGL
ncbi:MAG TPA: acyl-CoA dehydrogenase family protein [Caulobacteraceae bacterium]|nr:acyl-CoA dehydrogenase family protein [Caulobacteraceae bacterium]